MNEPASFLPGALWCFGPIQQRKHRAVDSVISLQSNEIESVRFFAIVAQ
jgi:hypothetical protein